MKKLLRFSAILFASFLTILSLAFVYLHYGPRKMHFSISHRPKVDFEQASPGSSLSDVTFHSLDGEPKQLSAYKGQVVILHRWGTWCAPCVAEMPAFQKLYDRYRDDPQVRFLVVASMNTPAEVRTFADRHHYDLPFYVADDKDDAGVSVSTFPKTQFYAKDGGLSQSKTGTIDWSGPSVMAEIEALKRY